MATDTYLQMVSDVITETGLNSGNAPSSIAAAAGDALKVAYWVRVADSRIQRERIDWDFLWEKPIVSLTEGSNIVPAQVHTISGNPSNTSTQLINRVNRKSLAIIDSNGEAHWPEFMEWPDFSVLYDYETPEIDDKPAFWAINPARAIKLSTLIENSGLTCKYEYWRKPIRLRDDSDVSLIPDDFNRLIIVLAKILYAEHEDAPEVSAGSHEEYDHLHNQMLAAHGPESAWSRMQSHDEALVVYPE